MSNNGEVEFDGDSWFFAFEDSRKVREIDADPRTELAFIDTPNGTWVNVEGEARWSVTTRSASGALAGRPRAVVL